MQSQNLWKVYRQEEREDQGADQCHPSALNRRLRATQSPNDFQARIRQLTILCVCDDNDLE